MKTFLKSIYINTLLYYIVSAQVVFFVFAFFFPNLFNYAKLSMLMIAALFFMDIVILYANKKGLFVDEILLISFLMVMITLFKFI